MSFFEQLSLFRLPEPSVVPQRRRQLLIGSRVIDYELRQAAGRRLGLTIDERGLRVGAPRRMPLHVIEGFVTENGAWVLRKLDEYVARAAPRHLGIRDGVLVPVLGDALPVSVCVGGNRIRWHGDRLELAARPDADLNALARRALQQRAMTHFRQRAEALIVPLGRPLPNLALSSARTRWGSCSARSGIRIHWRLIHLPPACADYVIAHELAHLVHMDHSPRFWRQVEVLFPDWQRVRAELKARAAEIPLI
jgi:predicted metal-dependent hydrolase